MDKIVRFRITLTVACEKAPFLMTLNDFEGHFSCSKAFEIQYYTVTWKHIAYSLGTSM